VALILWCSTLYAEPRITLELATEPGFSITGQQKLARDVAALDVGSVRIRQASGGESAKVEEIGKNGESFAVTALVSRDGKIIVPGARFSIDQLPQFKVWLSKLATNNPNEPQEELAAFGLSPEQLVFVHEQLAGKVAFETKGQAVGDIVKKLTRELSLTVSIDADARRALEAGEVTPDELSGIAHGTALAAVLRPAGLVFAPERKGKGKADVALRIADARTLAQSWPIGWPPQQGLTETLPSLGKFLNVEINEVVLQSALDSIQKRVEAPFLYDHNGILRQRIDMSTRKVSLAPGKTYYKKILDRILGQAHLQCEVRVDEADTPFLWVSPVK
jgi:hypothetical protein